VGSKISDISYFISDTLLYATASGSTFGSTDGFISPFELFDSGTLTAPLTLFISYIFFSDSIYCFPSLESAVIMGRGSLY